MQIDHNDVENNSDPDNTLNDVLCLFHVLCVQVELLDIRSKQVLPSTYFSIHSASYLIEIDLFHLLKASNVLLIILIEILNYVLRHSGGIKMVLIIL